MKFRLVYQEAMSFKKNHIYSSGSLFVRWIGTICAILEEGIMRNDTVKLV